MKEKKEHLLNDVYRLTLTKIVSIHRMTSQVIEKRLACLGITMTDFRITGVLLACSDCVNQKKLSEKLQIQPSTFSVAISKLEKKGVIQRVTDTEDARIKHIKLLEIASIKNVLENLKLVEANAMKGLGKIETKKIQRTLTTMIENLRKLNNKNTKRGVHYEQKRKKTINTK